MGIITNRRRVMGGKPLLNYVEVGYLSMAASANTYFELPINVNTLDYCLEFKSDNAVFWGWCYQGAPSNTWICSGESVYSHDFYSRYQLATNLKQGIHTYKYDMRRGFYVDGSLVKSFVVSLGNSSISTIPLSVFVIRDASPTHNNSKPSLPPLLYWMKVYKNDALLYNMIPVRINEIGYMYDKVSGQLFGNRGTGEFILGPDVSN